VFRSFLAVCAQVHLRFFFSLFVFLWFYLFPGYSFFFGSWASLERAVFSLRALLVHLFSLFLSGPAVFPPRPSFPSTCGFLLGPGWDPFNPPIWRLVFF